MARKQAVAPEDQTAKWAAWVDELGDLEIELAPMALKVARRDALRKSIRELYVNCDPKQAFSIDGSRFVAAIGPRANERYVELARLRKAVGINRYVELSDVTLKALSMSGLPPETQESLITVEQTGTRPLAIQQRGGAK